jgi:hypothetical protein
MHLCVGNHCERGWLSAKKPSNSSPLGHSKDRLLLLTRSPKEFLRGFGSGYLSYAARSTDCVLTTFVCATNVMYSRKMNAEAERLQVFPGKTGRYGYRDLTSLRYSIYRSIRTHRYHDISIDVSKSRNILLSLCFLSQHPPCRCKGLFFIVSNQFFFPPSSA